MTGQGTHRGVPAGVENSETPVWIVHCLDCSSPGALPYPYWRVHWCIDATSQSVSTCGRATLLLTVVIDLMTIVHNQHCITWQLDSKVSDVSALSWLKSSKSKSVCHVRIIFYTCKRHSALSAKPTIVPTPSMYQTVKSCLVLSACDPFLARI